MSRKDLSLSSSSATAASRGDQCAACVPVGVPPIAQAGSRPTLSRMWRIIAAVLVFPWVPVTAVQWWSASTSSRACARWTIGMPCRWAATNSTFVGSIAEERITTLRPFTFSARWPLEAGRSR